MVVTNLVAFPNFARFSVCLSVSYLEHVAGVRANGEVDIDVCSDLAARREQGGVRWSHDEEHQGVNER